MIVDGNDPLDVYATVHSALRHARKGEGPALVECKTYRYLAHTSDDDDRTYRTPQEVEAWRKKDPLQRMKQYLIEQRLLSEQDEDRIEAEVKAEVDGAAKRAEAARPTGRRPPSRRSSPGRCGRCRACRPSSPPARRGSPRPTCRAVPGGGVRAFVDTVRETLRGAMAADDRVFVLGEDVGNRGGVFKATDGLITEFGEQPGGRHAAGRVVHHRHRPSASPWPGLRPIAEIQFADFIHPAFDQLVSEAARIHYRSNGDFRVPLVVRAPWGGGVHGALYHSQSIEAFYAHVPGLKVVVPSTPADVAGLLREAVDDPDPVLFLEHKKTYRLIKGMVPEGDWRVPIGVADVARRGDDLTVVTYGLHRHLALEAADRLAAEGIGEVEVSTCAPSRRSTGRSSGLGRQDGPGAGRARGQPLVLGRRRGGRDRRRGSLLRPRRAGHAAGHRRRAVHALRPGAQAAVLITTIGSPTPPGGCCRHKYTAWAWDACWPWPTRGVWPGHGGWAAGSPWPSRSSSPPVPAAEAEAARAAGRARPARSSSAPPTRCRTASTRPRPTTTSARRSSRTRPRRW